MSMRVRDLQQYLGKFTLDQKGTAISNCRIYIETANGHLEEIRKIEIQESNGETIKVAARVYRKLDL